MSSVLQVSLSVLAGLQHEVYLFFVSDIGAEELFTRQFSRTSMVVFSQCCRCHYLWQVCDHA